MFVHVCIHVYTCVFIQIHIHKVYLSITYIFYICYLLYVYKEEREKEKETQIRCEINTVNNFSLSSHYTLVCQSRNLMDLTAHHFQDAFNNPH